MVSNFKPASIVGLDLLVQPILELMKPINIDLSAAVDVYSDWIDACDTVAKEEASGRVPASGLSRFSGLGASRRLDEEEDDADLDGYAERGEGDGFIDDEDDPGHAASEID